MKLGKRIVQNDAVLNVLCWLVARYVRLVHHTGRWRTVRLDNAQRLWDAGEPFIGCFWHGRLMMMPRIWASDMPIRVVISQHADGRVLSRAVGHLGIETIAGSRSRGGATAYRGVLRALAAGESVGFTPDGPRGPRMRISPGIIATASRTGRPILCATFSTTRRRVLRTWDRFVVPLPFGRGVFVWGEPVVVPRDADDDELERKRRELEDRLNEITREADALCGWPEMAPADEAVGRGNPERRRKSRAAADGAR